MDTSRRGEPSPTTPDEYRRALTRLTKRARKNGVPVESYWCCRADDETVDWEVEVVPLASDDWQP